MAGSRGGDDPLASASGVAFKALTPVAGVAMLARVVDTIRSAAWATRVVVCGLDAAAAAHVVGDGVEVVRGERTPGASAARTIAELRLEPPILITTADHPLLTPDTLDAFCERSAATNADVTFGLVPVALVHGAFPGVRRTAYRFRDGDFCGCNLYALLTTAGCRAPTLWAEVEGHRKRPWRLVGTLGAGSLLRFVLGRLASADLTGLVFARTGLRVRPVFLSDPAAGFDVDTPEQRRAAERFLLEREGRTATTRGP
jgi:GTP:adenosylcobinamide-phosphate guanylyltransferase